MPVGHAESNDLLRNRERSIRAREKLRNGVREKYKDENLSGSVFSVNQESQTFYACGMSMKEQL